MRILVLGAGAIGTYTGCSLIEAGADVIFFDRPETCEWIKQNGLSVVRENATIHISQPDCVSDLNAAFSRNSYDLAILAVKSFDTEGIVNQLKPFSSLPPFLSLQNGVENESWLATQLPASDIIYGSVTTAINRKATGEVVVERLRGIGLAGKHPIVDKTIALFNRAELVASEIPYKNAMAMKWSKMLTNLLTNAQAAILQMLPSQIMADSRLFAVEAEQMREAFRVMSMLNFPVIDLPGTPIRLMKFLFTRFPCWLARPVMAKAAGQGRGDKLPSLLMDIQAGRRQSEVHYLNGAVSHFGKQIGIATPVNQFLNETLQKIAEGEIPEELYNREPARMLADLEKYRAQF